MHSALIWPSQRAQARPGSPIGGVAAPCPARPVPPAHSRAVPRTQRPSAQRPCRPAPTRPCRTAPSSRAQAPSASLHAHPRARLRARPRARLCQCLANAQMGTSPLQVLQFFFSSFPVASLLLHTCSGLNTAIPTLNNLYVFTLTFIYNFISLSLNRINLVKFISFYFLCSNFTHCKTPKIFHTSSYAINQAYMHPIYQLIT